jgi:hypothetical protein
MLTNAIIANIRAFLLRAELRGAEVAAYNEIITVLDAIERVNNTPPPPE